MEGVINNKPVPYSTAFGQVHGDSDFLNLRFLLTNKQVVKTNNCGSHIIKLCDNEELEQVTSAIIEWAACRNVYVVSDQQNDPFIIVTLVSDLSTNEVFAIDVSVHEDYVDATNDFVLWGIIDGVRTMLTRGRIYTIKATKILTGDEDMEPGTPTYFLIYDEDGRPTESLLSNDPVGSQVLVWGGEAIAANNFVRADQNASPLLSLRDALHNRMGALIDPKVTNQVFIRRIGLPVGLTDFYTCPAGKKAILRELIYYNHGVGNAETIFYKKSVDASYSQLTPAVNFNPGARGSVNRVMVLEEGETYAMQFLAAGVDMHGEVVEIPADSALRTIHEPALSFVGSEPTLFYQVPAGMTAIAVGEQGLNMPNTGGVSSFWVRVFGIGGQIISGWYVPAGETFDPAIHLMSTGALGVSWTSAFAIPITMRAGDAIYLGSDLASCNAFLTVVEIPTPVVAVPF